MARGEQHPQGGGGGRAAAGARRSPYGEGGAPQGGGGGPPEGRFGYPSGNAQNAGREGGVRNRMGAAQSPQMQQAERRGPGDKRDSLTERRDAAEAAVPDRPAAFRRDSQQQQQQQQQVGARQGNAWGKMAESRRHQGGPGAAHGTFQGTPEGGPSGFFTDGQIAAAASKREGKAPGPRPLVKWTGGGTDEPLQTLEELGGPLGGPSSWDQFKDNRERFGVSSTYKEEIYTTALDRTAIPPQLREKANRLAREMEAEAAYRLQDSSLDAGAEDEEAMFSAVRGTGGYARRQGGFAAAAATAAAAQAPQQQQQQQGPPAAAEGDSAYGLAAGGPAREEKASSGSSRGTAASSSNAGQQRGAATEDAQQLQKTLRPLLASGSPSSRSPALQASRVFSALNLEHSLPKIDERAQQVWLRFKKTTEGRSPSQGGDRRHEKMQLLNSSKQIQQLLDGRKAGSSQGKGKAVLEGCEALRSPSAPSSARASPTAAARAALIMGDASADGEGQQRTATGTAATATAAAAVAGAPAGSSSSSGPKKNFQFNPHANCFTPSTPSHAAATYRLAVAGGAAATTAAAAAGSADATRQQGGGAPATSAPLHGGTGRAPEAGEKSSSNNSVQQQQQQQQQMQLAAAGRAHPHSGLGVGGPSPPCVAMPPPLGVYSAAAIPGAAAAAGAPHAYGGPPTPGGVLADPAEAALVLDSTTLALGSPFGPEGPPFAHAGYPIGIPPLGLMPPGVVAQQSPLIPQQVRPMLQQQGAGGGPMHAAGGAGGLRHAVPSKLSAFNAPYPSKGAASRREGNSASCSLSSFLAPLDSLCLTERADADVPNWGPLGEHSYRSVWSDVPGVGGFPSPGLEAIGSLGPPYSLRLHRPGLPTSPVFNFGQPLLLPNAALGGPPGAPGASMPYPVMYAAAPQLPPGHPYALLSVAAVPPPQHQQQHHQQQHHQAAVPAPPGPTGKQQRQQQQQQGGAPLDTQQQQEAAGAAAAPQGGVRGGASPHMGGRASMPGVSPGGSSHKSHKGNFSGHNSHRQQQQQHYSPQMPARGPAYGPGGGAQQQQQMQPLASSSRSIAGAATPPPAPMHLVPQGVGGPPAAGAPQAAGERTAAQLPPARAPSSNGTVLGPPAHL